MDAQVISTPLVPSVARTHSTTVRLRELSKRYGAQLAVDSLSLTVEPGSMLALLGPSGCGNYRSSETPIAVSDCAAVFEPSIAAISTLMILLAMVIVVVLERVMGLRRAMAI